MGINFGTGDYSFPAVSFFSDTDCQTTAIDAFDDVYMQDSGSGSGFGCVSTGEYGTVKSVITLSDQDEGLIQR